MPLINLGQYLPGDTLLHRLDPRLKIVAVILLSIAIFGAGAPQIAGISAALAAVIGAARLAPSRIAG